MLWRPSVQVTVSPVMMVAPEKFPWKELPMKVSAKPLFTPVCALSNDMIGSW